jgi:DNA-binding response OmpR family regulator
MRILVVEDDPRMAGLLSRALRETGYAVDIARDGIQGADQASLVPYDLVVLDVMLPGMDGFSVCQRVRAAHGRMPILMLSARTEISDRVRGLDLGADDYLPKPFAIEELRARVGALLRRRTLPQQISLTVVNHAQRWITHLGNVAAPLAGVLVADYLLLNRGRIVTRREIAEHVWDEHFDPFSNLIEVYVGRLRQKIDASTDAKTSFLTTRRGEGYFVEDLSQETN